MFSMIIAMSVLAVAGNVVEEARLPSTWLQGKPALSGKALSTRLKAAGRQTKGAALKQAGVPGIDSLANFTGQFTTPGFDSDGNPQSAWPFSMVGAAPESGRTTQINAPIIPVIVEMLDKNGNLARASTGASRRQNVTPEVVGAVVHSPLFESASYTSGFGQFNDQMMRAQFWDRIHRSHGHKVADDDKSDSDDGYHTLLRPAVKTTRTLQLPYGSYGYALNDDGTCCLFVIADANAFVGALFPATAPVDASTTIGAAELAGDMTTKDLSTLLFKDVYLSDSGDCCILGFHTYDLEPGNAKNGNRDQRFVTNYSSWISPGLFGGGFTDITALSHEVAETFNDPFVDNLTPWWLATDPFSGYANCQNDLESGDVIEVLSSNAVYPMALSGRTYHPQNEALFPWFAFQSPSKARMGAYSFPDETTLTALSPGSLLPGCVPAAKTH